MKTLMAFIWGFLVGILLMLMLANEVTSQYRSCVSAQLDGVAIIWTLDTTPFCSVDIEVNGKIKTVTLPDYYEYIK